jgi:integrase
VTVWPSVSPPRWAVTFFVSCELSVHSTISATWTRSLECARRYLASPELLANYNDVRAAARESLDLENYTIGALEKEKAFRRIRPEAISMPPQGSPPTDGISLLEWPHSLLFEDLEAFAADQGSRATPLGKVAMEEGENYADMLKKMHGANMLKFFRPSEAPPGPANGLFAVLKDEQLRTLRLILDGKPGNARWDATKMQARYEEILASDPARTAALGLDKRLMAMPDSAAFSQLPSGACLVSERDFSAYFYGILQHPQLLGSQRLPPVDGKALGQGWPPGPWVPVMTVMSMGNWLSATLAQLIHRATLLPLIRTGAWAVGPAAQTTERRRIVGLLRDVCDSDGLVGVDQVPASLLAEVARVQPGLQQVPPGLRVPVEAFELELVDKTRARRTSGADCFELRLRLYHRGCQGRFELTAARAAKQGPGGEGWHSLLCLLSAYIDDEAQAYYDVGDSMTAREQRQASSLLTLLTIAAGGAAGLRENVKKLRWPSRRGGKHLGVEYRFADERLEFEVATPRRQVLSERLRLVAESAAKTIDEDVFDSLLGNVVWAVMCRREFLSIFRVTYRARHSPNRPPKRILLTPALREELLMASWAMPLLWASSTKDAQLLTMYDASGTNARGNGGFGVCSRAGLHPRTAAELMMAMGGQHGPLAAFAEPEPGRPPANRAHTEPHREAALAASQLLKFDWEARSGPWVAAQRGEFRTAPPHINVAEAVTGILAGRHASTLAARTLSTGASLVGVRLVVGGDNTVACTVLTKGRSSTVALNNQCRRAAVYSFVRRCRFGWFWVPSATNPADGPSRWWTTGERRDYQGRLTSTAPRTPAAKRRLRRYKRRAALTSASSHGDRREWIPDLWMCGDVHPHPGPPAGRRTPAPSKLHRYCGRVFAAVPHDEVIRERGPAAALKLSVRPKTYAKYLRAIQGLNCFIGDHGSEFDGLAEALAGYVNYAMLSGGQVTRGRARTMLTALGFFAPELKSQTRLAWKFVDGWIADVPTKRKVPVPDHINDLLAVTLLASGRPGSYDAGIAALVAQHTYCRGGEVVELRVGDVFLPGHPGTFDLHNGLLHLRGASGATKGCRTGETVILDCPRTIAVLRRHTDTRHSDELLFDFGTKTLLWWFKWAQVEAGYPKPIFVAHSWRHGGASGDMTHGRRRTDQIQLRGRWKDARTMLIYLNSAATVLAEVHCPPEISEYFADDPWRADRIIRRFFGAPPRRK